MKKALILLHSIFILSSCEKERPNIILEKNSINKVFEAKDKSSGFGPNIFNIAYSFTNLNEYEATQDNGDSEYFGMADISQNDLNSIAEYINTFYNIAIGQSNNYAFCFYLDNDFTTKSISQSNITGISIIYLNNTNKIEHRYFKINNSTLNENSSFQSEFGTLSINDFSILLFESNSGKTRNTSFFCLFSEEFYNLSPPSFGTERLSKVLIENGNYLPTSAEGGNNCNFCNSGLNNACESKGGAPFTCPREGDWTCMEERLIAVGTNDPNFQPETSVPSQDAYAFRDNYLQTTVIGRKYINYYYQLSNIGILLETLDTSNFDIHLDFATDMFIVAERLTNQENNVIVIDSNIKYKIENFINTYRTITDNLEYQRILDDIESDVNFFYGLTRSEIETEIGI